jgi:hypothetical protein
MDDSKAEKVLERVEVMGLGEAENGPESDRKSNHAVDRLPNRLPACPEGAVVQRGGDSRQPLDV